MKLDDLKAATKGKRVISFEYNKEGKSRGLRIGNPHAVFIMRTKDGKESTKVHIVQTAGVSDSEQPFPSFRMFDFENLDNIKLLEPTQTFEASPQYNPLWEGYKSVITKI